MGIPLTQLNNRRIIEFGPGGGYNAVASTFYNPDLYVFVDATKASLNKLKSMQKDRQFNATNIEIIDSNIYDYKDDRLFDFVICEGVLCGQTHPEKMLHHISRFVQKSGILLITTTSASSYLSEICRRVLRVVITQMDLKFEHRLSF